MKRPLFLTPQSWQAHTRFLWLLLTMTLLPILVVEGLSIRQAAQTLSTSAQANASHAAERHAAQIADRLASQVRLTSLLASSNTVVTLIRSANSSYAADPVAARAAVAQAELAWPADEQNTPTILAVVDHPLADQLRAFQAQTPGMADMLVTDAFGAVVASTRQLRHYDMSTEQWWQAAWAVPNVADLRMGALDRADAGTGLLITIPIVSMTTAQTIGVLRASYHMRFIAQDLPQQTAPDAPEILIVGGDQQVLASTAAGRGGTGNLAVPESADANDLLVVACSLPARALLPNLSELGWRVVVVQQNDRVFAPIRTQVIGAISTSVVVVLTSLFIALVVVKRILRPLTSLAAVATSGDLAALATTTPPTAGDEVSSLARSLQQLAQHVLQSQEEMAAIGAGLEQHIANRTMALQQLFQQQQDLLATQRQLLAQIAQMPISVLPIIPGVVLIPLIGAIDEQRAQALSETMLPEVERAHARIILLDMTGVPIMDTQVAATILNAMQSAQLLGAHSILVGIRPEIALTLVGLGVHLEVDTTASLQEGLRRASHRLQRASRA